MTKRLYFGNLPYETTEEDLQNAFAQVGTVESAKLIIDRESGRSKGFGFVEMSTEDEAKKAIEQLHNQRMGSRPMTVNEARPQESRRPR